jgi:hypothetical protein
VAPHVREFVRQDRLHLAGVRLVSAAIGSSTTGRSHPITDGVSIVSESTT